MELERGHVCLASKVDEVARQERWHTQDVPADMELLSDYRQGRDKKIHLIIGLSGHRPTLQAEASGQRPRARDQCR